MELKPPGINTKRQIPQEKKSPMGVIASNPYRAKAADFDSAIESLDMLNSDQAERDRH